MTVEPLHGGLTNLTFLVSVGGRRYVARLPAADTPHPIDRAAERAATEAAAAAGIGPRLVYAEQGAIVLEHIAGRTLAAVELARPDMLPRAVALVRRLRVLGPLYRGPRVDRSPAAILGHYLARLDGVPNRWRDAALARAPLCALAAARLNALPRRLCHNDIHAANLIEDGERLFLVDWEYAGDAPPLVDMASLAVNGLMDDGATRHALDLFGATAQEHAGLDAARLAAALRDLLWGYAQDAFGSPFDAESYIAVNEGRVAEAAARLV